MKKITKEEYDKIKRISPYLVTRTKRNYYVLGGKKYIDNPGSNKRENTSKKPNTI